MKNQPVIHILIRTHNRPELFERCIKSIFSQTYTNFKISICSDTLMSKNYVNKLIKSYRLNKKNDDVFQNNIYIMQNGVKFNWNLYCNILKDNITITKFEESNTWLCFLDDDDILDNANSLKNLAHHLNDPSEAQVINNEIPIYALVCQYRRKKAHHLQLKPMNSMMETGEIIQGHIDMTCIFIHHSKKNLVNFKPIEFADYHFIKEVSEKIPIKFAKEVFALKDHKSRGK